MQQNLHYFDDYLKVNFNLKFECLIDFYHILFLDFLNVTVLVNYGRENIGSIFSILDSIWTILKGNLSLVFKSTTAILSVLMGGGTAILNFFVNGVNIFHN